MNGLQSPEVESSENWFYVVCELLASTRAEHKPRDILWVRHPAIIDGAYLGVIMDSELLFRPYISQLVNLFPAAALYKKQRAVCMPCRRMQQKQ